ncbi:MAG: hypothetical protein HC921_08525 [Synechococcaceae cyanobacterium SM2_3_1]|nr:hypothetical protein [Synechococcaceae cyanobacterium SM2_3_1]
MILLLYIAAVVLLFMASILYVRSLQEQEPSPDASSQPFRRKNRDGWTSRSRSEHQVDIRDRMADMDREQLLDLLEKQFQNSPSSPES